MANLYAILILIALNIFCYFRSFSGFFLADDFSHIDYLHTVFAGHPELLLQNFFSNWLQAQGTKFFRPFISITLAWDYLFWKNNPLGFHITNVSLQLASTLLLFFIVKRLFPLPTNKSFSLALAAAALFAVNPLHPEVVSWIIARVDSTAATFLLAAFYLHQRGLSKPKKHWFNIMSLVSFIIALLSKETAIILPPVLFLWHFIFPSQHALAQNREIPPLLQGESQAMPGSKGEQKENNFVNSPEKFSLVTRFKIATSATWIYWSTLVIYIIYRALALGTVIGGYGGAVGDGLQNSIWRRWSDPVSIEKVFYPFNDEVFHNSSRYRRLLRWSYQVGMVLFVANSFFAFKTRRLVLDWSMITFAAGWFVISMIPAYQVWNLTSNLQGSRFIYMGSLPLSLLFSLIVIPAFIKPEAKKQSLLFKDRNTKVVSLVIQKRQDIFASPIASLLTAASCVVVVAYICVCSTITQKNDSAWFHASRGVKALYKAVKAELAALPADRSMVILNLPSRYQGAHMLYNGFTFGALLRPPFMAQDNSKRIQLFEPIEFGDSDLLNVSRLKALAQGKDKPEIFKWSETENKLFPVNLAWTPAKINFKQIDSAHISPGQLVYAPEVFLSSGAVDYLDIKMTIPASSNYPQYAKLVWAGPSMTFAPKNFLWNQVTRDGTNITTRFNVSEHKIWLESGAITKIGLELLPSLNYDLKNFEIIAGRLQNIPELTAGQPADTKSGGMVEDQLGMAHPHKMIGYMHYDVSKIPDADHVVFQISKPDSWFEQAKDTFRSTETDNAQIGLRHEFKALKGDGVVFPATELKAPGFYEVRLGAVAKNGDILVSYSDPINFYISEADLYASK